MKKSFPVVIGIILLIFLVGCSTQREENSAAVTSMLPGESNGQNASLETEDSALATPLSSAESNEQNASSEYENNTFITEVAGLKLQYPLRWKDLVSIDVDTNAATFSFGNEKLFTLFFNCPDKGNVLGTVCGDENIVITISDYDVSDGNAVSMQEDVNVILQHLIEDYDFVVGEAIVKESNDVFAINTSVTTLYYPAKWQDVVTVEVSDTKVCFTYDNGSLFDLVFTETENGFLLGTYENTPIYVVDYEVSSNEASAMQEDVNVILHYLMEDGNFSINY